jgi:threonine/homoserine/homoserine lactone efflux protein
MFDPSTWLPFVAASIVLMLIPGPNVALIVANSVGQGTRAGLLTVAGTASAMALQLLAVGLGLAGLLGTLGHAFDWIRWLGVLYLLALGIRQWLTTPAPLTQPPSRQRVWRRAFLVSLSNPKTLLFYGAFFPQFLSPHANAAAQAATLCATFLLVAITIDSLWALAAGRARGLLGRHRWHNRASGAVLIGAGLGLALQRSR